MLKLFKKRKKPNFEKPPEPEYLKELSWSLRMVLKLRLNPFAGRIFFHDIICMAAKMASVDGPVSEIELKVFMELLEREFSLTKNQKKTARALLFEAHHSDKKFSDFAHEFHRYFRKEPAFLENALDVLLSMAYSDGVFSLGEQKIMAEAAQIFGISPGVLDRLTRRHHKSTTVVERHEAGAKQTREKKTERFHSERKSDGEKERARTEARPPPRTEQPADAWFVVLGVQPMDSPAVIKRAYRKLVLRYHPDKLPSNIPEEMKRASTERFIAIQRAYEQFTRISGGITR